MKGSHLFFTLTRTSEATLASDESTGHRHHSVRPPVGFFKVFFFHCTTLFHSASSCLIVFLQTMWNFHPTTRVLFCCNIDLQPTFMCINVYIYPSTQLLQEPSLLNSSWNFTAFVLRSLQTLSRCLRVLHLCPGFGGLAANLIFYFISLYCKVFKHIATLVHVFIHLNTQRAD